MAKLFEEPIIDVEGQVEEKPKKVKKARKPLSDERKEQLREQLKAARLASQEKRGAKAIAKKLEKQEKDKDEIDSKLEKYAKKRGVIKNNDEIEGYKKQIEDLKKQLEMKKEKVNEVKQEIKELPKEEKKDKKDEISLLKEEMAEMRKLMKEMKDNKPQAEQVRTSSVKPQKQEPIKIDKPPETKKDQPKPIPNNSLSVSLGSKYLGKKRWLKGL